MVTMPPARIRYRRAWAVLRGAGTVLLYGLMLLAVLAMWNTQVPFIYVAF